MDRVVGRNMKKKRKHRNPAPKRKHGQNAMWKVEALRRMELSLQRTGFTGAIRYQSGRKKCDTFLLILRQCMGTDQLDPNSPSIRALLAQESISIGALDRYVNAFWPSDVACGNRVFEFLKAAGYGGHIDDLWLSMYGMRKPSIPTAGVKSRRGALAKRARSRSLFIVGSGQTRKPGSHSS